MSGIHHPLLRMKIINTSVSVDAHKGVPRRISRGKRIYTVRRVLDFWILQSRWWGYEEKRIYFRLETDGGVLEVYRAEASPAGGAAAERSVGGRKAAESKAAAEPGATASAEPPLADSAEPGATAVAEPLEGAAPPPVAAGHPPFIEGDTHTRELRQTESPYRPDAAALADRRHAKGSGATRRTAASRSRWVLSKVMD